MEKTSADNSIFEVLEDFEELYRLIFHWWWNRPLKQVPKYSHHVARPLVAVLFKMYYWL